MYSARSTSVRYSRFLWRRRQRSRVELPIGCTRNPEWSDRDRPALERRDEFPSSHRVSPPGLAVSWAVLFVHHSKIRRRWRLWVKSRHRSASAQCPLYPDSGHRLRPLCSPAAGSGEEHDQRRRSVSRRSIALRTATASRAACSIVTSPHRRRTPRDRNATNNRRWSNIPRRTASGGYAFGSGTKWCLCASSLGVQ